MEQHSEAVEIGVGNAPFDEAPEQVTVGVDLAGNIEWILDHHERWRDSRESLASRRGKVRQLDAARRGEVGEQPGASTRDR